MATDSITLHLISIMTTQKFKRSEIKTDALKTTTGGLALTGIGMGIIFGAKAISGATAAKAVAGTATAATAAGIAAS